MALYPALVHVEDFGPAASSSPRSAAPNAFAAALADVGASGTVQVSSTQTITTNTTIPAGVGLHINPGGSLQGPSSGGPVILTLLGQPFAGPYQIFGSNLTVIPGPNVRMLPEWAAGAGASNWLYLPPGWDNAWRSAKAAAGSAVARVLLWGDSIAQGAFCSDLMSKSWTALVGAALQSMYGKAGDYWPTSFSAKYMTDLSTVVSGTPPWTVSGTNFDRWYPRILGNVPAWNSAAVTNPASFTSPYACTQLDLLWYDNGGVGAGSFTYNVDGGATQTVNTGATNYQRLTGTAGLASAVHTLNILGQSGADVLMPAGVTTWANPVAGVAVAHAGFGGFQAANLSGLSTGNVDLCTLLSGATAAATPNGITFPQAPHLAIVELGINDMQNVIGPGNYRQMLRRFVQAFRRGVPHCSILLLAPCSPDTASSDATGSLFTNSSSWPLYRTAMLDTAHAYGCAYLDVHAKWGETPVGSGYLAAGNAHPIDAGHADIATTLLNVL